MHLARSAARFMYENAIPLRFFYEKAIPLNDVSAFLASQTWQQKS
jgi:hypothetical protein